MKRSGNRNSKSLSRALAVLSAAVCLGAFASCGKRGDEGAAQVYRIPWTETGGDVHLQDVEIRTLTNPERFEGSTARILVEPSDGGGRLSGEAPVGRFIRTKSGVMVPTDYVTMQAVAAYAHQERLHDLDVRAGADALISWPLSLGIEVRVSGPGGLLTNNAIYDARLNSLLLVPYTEGDLPMSFSPGILGHEHFHFIFQSVVMSRVKDQGLQTSCTGAAPATATPEPAPIKSKIIVVEDPDSDRRTQQMATAKAMPASVYNSYVLRGMNEGFADFWGWLYSRDEFFLAKSLPGESDRRRLDWGPGRLPTEELIRSQLVDVEHPDKIMGDAGRAQNAYILGSQYARFLRQTVADLVRENGTSEDEAALMVARALIQSLPSIATTIAASYETEFLSPNAIVKPLLLALPKISRGVCARIGSFHAPESGFEKPRACDVFKDEKPIAKPSPSPKAQGGV